MPMSMSTLLVYDVKLILKNNVLVRKKIFKTIVGIFDDIICLADMLANCFKPFSRLAYKLSMYPLNMVKLYMLLKHKKLVD